MFNLNLNWSIYSKYTSPSLICHFLFSLSKYPIWFLSACQESTMCTSSVLEQQKVSSVHLSCKRSSWRLCRGWTQRTYTPTSEHLLSTSWSSAASRPTCRYSTHTQSLHFVRLEEWRWSNVTLSVLLAIPSITACRPAVHCGGHLIYEKKKKIHLDTILSMPH